MDIWETELTSSLYSSKYFFSSPIFFGPKELPLGIFFLLAFLISPYLFNNSFNLFSSNFLSGK